MKIRKFSNGVLVSETEVPDPIATVEDVRAEASRRLQVTFSARDSAHLSQIITNAQRESTRLYAKRLGVPGIIAGREWTPEEATRAAQLYAADQFIEAVRAASNAMEDNPPQDYASDARWPTLASVMIPTEPYRPMVDDVREDVTDIKSRLDATHALVIQALEGINNGP